MNSFPHTDAYLVLFPPGGSGHFIVSMLGNFVYNSKLNLSIRGDAHKKNFTHNYESYSSNLWAKLVMTLNVPSFKIINPNDETLPIFFNEHFVSNFDIFFERYPKGKIIIITSTEKDILRMRVSAFIKSFLRNYNNKVFNKNWEIFLKNNQQFINKDPNKFTEKDYREMLNLVGDSNQYYTEFQTDKEIYFISYNKIISDMNYTLDLLSKVTEKPITEDMKNDYLHYLSKQEQTLKEYAPWILTPQSDS